MLNALTIDVEDYYHVSGCERTVDRNAWPMYESRVVENTQRLLELLEAYRVRATFFVLGWVSDRFPQLVRQIRALGHEIGSHSYWHRLVYQQTPDQFRDDLRRSRDVLQDTLGEPVTLYRAPSFSITQRSRWALEILVQEGFHVDSSIFPVRHDRYGMPDAETRIHRIETPSGTLWEFPPSVVRLGRVNVPVAGGGYFRLYPLAVTCRCIRQINHRQSIPAMFYVHPWEIDPRQPRVRFPSYLARFRHYLNLSSTQRKLEVLLNHVRFGTVSDAMKCFDQRLAEVD